MTSPTSGADSAQDPPGYAPVPRSVPGTQSVTGRAASPVAPVGGGNRHRGLEWVVNAYAVTFGGLLLGGRAGDIFGRRRVFIFGLLLFSAASLLIGIITIRVSRQEPAGAVPEPQEAAPPPATVQPAARRPGPRRGRRTEPPSPRRSVPAGSAANRHIITSREKSAGRLRRPA